MSKQALHTMVVTFNKLNEGDPQKNYFREIIKQEMVAKGNKPATTFSLAFS
ncbi:MAG: hypothetical protein KZQ64_06710 [gamma proteobacterium symbiont of Bathyaustriella thionipta]|nr:hypothetical protein [gamma proteobacterium symbiont of Bathyaustriella thionipta]MCU7953064.1 hypothetical protein [gamma proteobacterium symbiont of Bathyaustriella thionipta]MCU7957575.1 hypothetical protein [gamma proteobacterium symbiont of Bathyaustriella thionipta]MCU7965843.1 hypothetical protein [gamma proteobacterium symbiont of Bathyaustriella thionipta]